MKVYTVLPLIHFVSHGLIFLKSPRFLDIVCRIILLVIIFIVLKIKKEGNKNNATNKNKKLKGKIKMLKIMKKFTLHHIPSPPYITT